MFTVEPYLRKDFYKVGHVHQMKKGTHTLYSNFTPRGTHRVPAPPGIIWFGLQAYLKDTLIRDWNDKFFSEPRAKVLKKYKRVTDNCLGPHLDVNHLGQLHENGFLPLAIKSVPEGTLVPYRVPAATITNTDDPFAWLVNAIETDWSNNLWLPTTSATTAWGYWKRFHKYAKETGADPNFVQWQGHDFSYRGMAGLWAAAASAAAHLLFFTGTDTIPGILFLEEFYGADIENGLVGASVPATEHMVMCLSGKEGEFDLIKRLITEVYPKDIVSIVCDTWSLKKVVTEYLPLLKEVIMARDGKVVVRPDSGTPELIICGDPRSEDEFYKKGLHQALYELFGGSPASTGHILLDSHIGWIYGDSITESRQEKILYRLPQKGFAAQGVLGIGSFTYAHVTRDTDGWAYKATWAEDEDGENPLFKDPETDSGVKKSARGLLQVYRDESGVLKLKEDCTFAEEREGVLQSVFFNSALENQQTLDQVRAVAQSNV